MYYIVSLRTSLQTFLIPLKLLFLVSYESARGRFTIKTITVIINVQIKVFLGGVTAYLQKRDVVFFSTARRCVLITFTRWTEWSAQVGVVHPLHYRTPNNFIAILRQKRAIPLVFLSLMFAYLTYTAMYH